MKIFVHCAFSEGTISSRLGRADYSYYYVLTFFKPLLEQLGDVVFLDDPCRDLEQQALASTRAGEACLFLSFTPPHKMFTTPVCACLPVFAWEYGTLPSDTWNDDPRNDWCQVLRQCNGAITHSRYALDVTRNAMGPDYHLASIPAPLWDSMQDGAHQQNRPPHHGQSFVFDGHVIDSLTADFRAHAEERRALIARVTAEKTTCQVDLSGVVYTAIFNPNDGRKNWPDLLHAFCWAFRDAPDATLLIKITHHDPVFSMQFVLDELARTCPFAARIVVLFGYLDPEGYRSLVAASHFIVNSSHGEGQCLPLMEFMASGKPVIAPLHTAMKDYLSEQSGFPVNCSLEWTHWPHDPRALKRTYRYRIDWEDLVDALRDSHRLARHRWEAYLTMSCSARDASRSHCSRETQLEPLRQILTDAHAHWSATTAPTGPTHGNPSKSPGRWRPLLRRLLRAGTD